MGIYQCEFSDLVVFTQKAFNVSECNFSEQFFNKNAQEHESVLRAVTDVPFCILSWNTGSFELRQSGHIELIFCLYNGDVNCRGISVGSQFKSLFYSCMLHNVCLIIMYFSLSLSPSLSHTHTRAHTNTN
jgi:hypothetical protein